MNAQGIGGRTCKRFARALTSALGLAGVLMAETAQAVPGIDWQMGQPTFDTGENRQAFVDLRVQTLAGEVTVNRMWDRGNWQWNRSWANLEVIGDVACQKDAGFRKPSISSSRGIAASSSGSRAYSSGRITSSGSSGLNSGFGNEKFQGYVTPRPYAILRNGTGYLPTGNGRFTQQDTLFIDAHDQGKDGYTWSDRRGYTIHYNSCGQMTRYAGPNGVGNRLERDGEDRIVRVVDPNNVAVVTFEWTEDRVTKVKDHTGREVIYHYISQEEPATDEDGKPTTKTTWWLDKITDVRGKEWQLDYSGKSFTGVTSPEGDTSSISIDGNARLQSYRDGDGVGKSYSYSYNSSKEEHYTRVTDSAGTITEVWNNRLGMPIRRAVNGETVMTAKHTLSDNGTDVSKVTESYRSFGSVARSFRSASVGSSGGSSSFGGSSAIASNLSSKTQKKERPYVKLAEETDAFGNTTKKHYNRERDLLKTEYPDGTVSTSKYNNRGQRTEYIDVDGTKTLYEYDDRGNLITMTEAASTALARITTYTVNSLGQTTAITAPGASGSTSTTQFEYDAYGNLTKRTDPLGNVTQYQDYDVLGNPQTVIDARSNRWLSSYDAAGNVLTVTDPLNKVVTYHYDGNGRVQSITDPNDETTTLESNAAGLPTAVIDALEGRTELTYDKANRLTRILDAEGKLRKREYDQRGRLKALVDGNDNTTTWEYDNTRLTGIQYPTYKESYSYDNRDRTTTESQSFNANGQEGDESPLTELTRRFDYLIDSNLKQRSDANANTSGYEYDVLDRLTAITDAEGGITRYGYDARDNLTSVIDPEGRETRFEYNLRDEVTAEIKVGQGEVSDTRRSYQYDDNGNLTRITTPNGEVTVYSYDAANRLSAANYYASAAQQSQNQPEKTVSYSYTLTNQFAGYNDNQTEAAYQYDELNRLTQVTTTFNKNQPSEFSKTFSYSYYKNGLKKSYTNPEGQTYSYEYDNNNQLNGISIPGQGRISYAEYNWLSPTNIIYPGGSATQMVYDGLMRPLSKQTLDPASNAMLNLDWAYDNESNITQLGSRHGQQAKESASYSYDKLYRLTAADYNVSDDGFGEEVTPRTDEAFHYDGVGNRLDEKESTAELAPDVWTYNAFNQLTEQNGTSYDYSKNGHLIKSGKRNAQGTIATDPTNTIPYWEFVYNSEERLVEVKKNTATVARYQYNPLGQRTQKQLADGTTIHYLYSQEGMVGEYSDSGQLLQEYGWKPNGTWMTDPLFTRISDNVVHYYLNDHLGTPQKTFTRNGAVTWQARATAFGETAVHATSQITNNLRFAGQYFDGETGLHYNYFRDYAPDLGRYVQSDPIGLLGGNNTYVYVGARPLIFLDPLGLLPAPWCEWWEIVLGLCPDIGEDIKPEDVPKEWVDEKLKEWKGKPCGAVESSCKRVLGPGCYMGGSPCLVPCQVLKNKCEEEQKRLEGDNQAESSFNGEIGFEIFQQGYSKVYGSVSC